MPVSDWPGEGIIHWVSRLASRLSSAFRGARRRWRQEQGRAEFRASETLRHFRCKEPSVSGRIRKRRTRRYPAFFVLPHVRAAEKVAEFMSNSAAPFSESTSRPAPAAPRPRREPASSAAKAKETPLESSELAWLVEGCGDSCLTPSDQVAQSGARTCSASLPRFRLRPGQELGRGWRRRSHPFTTELVAPAAARAARAARARP
jgi:hypothetical protein